MGTLATGALYWGCFPTPTRQRRTTQRGTRRSKGRKGRTAESVFQQQARLHHARIRRVIQRRKRSRPATLHLFTRRVRRRLQRCCRLPRHKCAGEPRLTEKSTAIDREFYDYYRTPRGQHPRSTTALSVTSAASMMLFSAFERLDWISPRPVLFITGDRAHSRIFSEQAYKWAAEPKELHIVPEARHVDLYN